jgi:class 3 adenylate cyclase/pimeloyl-ACP methyl ester carboxylesterase
VERPATKYATSGEYHIAYQTLGEGPPDLVYVPGWISHLDLYWEEPSIARFLGSLASFARLIIFDKRGIGLSDPVAPSAMPNLEERTDDVRAILDAIGSERAALLGQGYGCPIAMFFAASHPERVTQLVLYAATVKAGVRTDDFPWGPTEEERRAWQKESAEWGTEAFAAAWVNRLAPSAADDVQFVEWAGRMMRTAASPATAKAFMRMQSFMDAREVLPLIRVPTLVLDRTDARLPKGPVDMPPLEESRYIAERIPGAKLVALPGRDYLPWIGDPDSVVSEVARFVTGAAPVRPADRVLVTVLFTDIVDSTRRASELGDSRWRELLGRHSALVRSYLSEYRGQEIDRAGDGFLATFDGPARAIRCAQAIIASSSREGLQIRAGVHSGEVELLEQGIGGIAVHIGARVAGLAAPREVLVTTTVSDLVAGSGIAFIDRGTHELKGVPGHWELLGAVDESQSA